MVSPVRLTYIIDNIRKRDWQRAIYLRSDVTCTPRYGALRYAHLVGARGNAALQAAGFLAHA